MHLPHFQQLLAQAAGRRPNPDQLQAILAPPSSPLFIVAGPGTGKTATLVLRILRLVFFDRIPPHAILAVTFTRKAADELRSRLQLWGHKLAQLLPAHPATLQPGIAPDPGNLQQLFAGTIDSLCQQLLIRYPDAATLPPDIADATLSDALLRQALLHDRRDTDPQLNALLLNLRGSEREILKTFAALGDADWRLRAVLMPTLLGGIVGQEGGHPGSGKLGHVSSAVSMSRPNHYSRCGYKRLISNPSPVLRVTMARCVDGRRRSASVTAFRTTG